MMSCVKEETEVNIEHEIITKKKDGEINIFDFKGENDDRFIPPHWHGSVEILFCLEGELNVWHTRKNKKYTLKKNDILLLNTNEVHSSQSPTTNHVLVIQLPIEFISKITNNLYNNVWHFELNTLETQNDYDIEVTLLAVSILELYESEGLENQFLFKSKLYELLALLVKNYTRTITSVKKLSTQDSLNKMEEIIIFIQKNYKEPISLTTIAREFNYSTSYFSRFFKKQMGSNFSDYILSVRLSHAHNLLLNSDWNLLDIALECGFNNVRSFYNGFEKIYNMSPTNYRKLKTGQNVS